MALIRPTTVAQCDRALAVISKELMKVKKSRKVSRYEDRALLLMNADAVLDLRNKLKRKRATTR